MPARPPLVYNILSKVQQVRVETRRAARSLVILALIVAGLKVARLAHLGVSLLGDVRSLQALAADPSASGVASAGPQIAAARHDLLGLRAEAAVFFWASPLFGWVPTYGPDLAASGRLVDLASNVMLAADEAYTGLTPLMQAAGPAGLGACKDSGPCGAAPGQAQSPTPAEVVRLLAVAQPRLRVASQAADRAVSARSEIEVEQLSPRLGSLITRLDPLLPLLQGGLAVSTVAPDLLGANGAKTYLILLQNQDEMRASGGFISAVGAVTVEHGNIVSMKIEDSYAVDDPTAKYPEAPEPLQQYMAAPIILMRDSNWSPDFPTTAALATQLYQISRPGKLDGVIAVDQAALQIVLGATGPVNVRGAPEPIGADNVIDFMHSAWSTAPEEGISYEWWLHRKDFMQDLAAALLDKLPSVSWIDLGQAAAQALQERHILVRLNDRQGAAALARQGWDGAVKPGDGDYWMAVDSNVGFNKMNAAVQTKLAYAVDLSDLAAPTGTLTVTQHNPAVGNLPCKQDPTYGSGQYSDMINRCYWDYLRIYTQRRTELLRATPHTVPGEWLLRGNTVLGHVSILPGENNTQTFQTLLVVPFGETLTTEFRYALDPAALHSWLGTTTYRLHIQKQSGARDVPLELSVQLPQGAELIGATLPGTLEGNTWRDELVLNQDQELRLTFRAR